MNESDRPRNALDTAAWIHSEGGGPENLKNILKQIAALRESLLALTLFHPSIPRCLDELRPLERYLRGRIRHIQGLSTAFEAENWQLDPTVPGGFKAILPPGIANAPEKGLNAYIKYWCRELNITSNSQQTRDQIAEKLPPGYDRSPRGPIGQAISNYRRTLPRRDT